MSTLGVMNKNSGQDTRIFGLHDNLFRRRIDLKREEVNANTSSVKILSTPYNLMISETEVNFNMFCFQGNEVFSYPNGPGSGTRNAMVWHPEPVDLQCECVIRSSENVGRKCT